MIRPELWIYESDPAKQTVQWADKLVTRFRIDLRPVVTTADYIRKKSKLLSAYELPYKKWFDDEDFMANEKFTPLPFMEKPRNIIVDKAREAGIKPYIQSIDPTAKKHKEQDQFRLMTKGTHTAQINKMRSTVGDGVPFNMHEKEFNGNVGEFDKMGMNPGDQSEVQFFFDTYYKLNYEGYAQNTVMAYLGVNRVEDDIPRYINDVMSVKVNCKQDFVSRATGQITTKYLQPNQVWAIFGNNRDASDAPVKQWLRQITVQELINILGNAFNFERDWFYLITAINYGNGQKFDGFMRGGRNYFSDDMFITQSDVALDKPAVERSNINLLDFDSVDTFNYKVYFGYIEWNQPCVHAEKRNKLTGQMFPVGADFVPSEKSQYEKEEWGYFKTITSNFLATGAYSQKLYNYGDLYMAQTKGDCDEYSCGTISIIREEGLAAIDIAEPYIDLGNYAYYKMLWAIHRSKPDVWSWAYESIREVAMKMNQSVVSGTNTPQKAGGFGDAINNLIDQFDKRLVMMHTMPVVNGQPVGGGGNPHIKYPGALDPIAVELRQIVLEWAEKQIGDKLGLEGLANADAPNPRDGLKLNQLYLQQSKSAIGYIQRMIDASFRHTARLHLQFIQDILRFPGTLPYNYLLNLVGDEAVEGLAALGTDAAPHRFAIYATSFSIIPEKQQMLQEAMQAYQKGLLSFTELQLIKNTEEPIIAAKTSAHFQEKAQKRIEAQTAAAQKAAQALRDSDNKAKFETAKYIADVGLEKERVRTNGYIYQADKAFEAKMAGHQQQQSNQEKKLEDQKQLLQDKATIDLQKSLLEQ